MDRTWAVGILVRAEVIVVVVGAAMGAATDNCCVRNTVRAENAAHLGGAAFGLLIGLVLRRRLVRRY